MFLGGTKARRWRWIGAALLVAAAVPFALEAARGRYLHGGSAWGLTYGIAAAVLILVLLFFGLRKRWYRSTWGSLEGWLQSHLWLGVVAMAAALFHAGGRFAHQDRLAAWTFWVMAAVVASGLLGVAVYSLVPRLFTDAGANRSVAEISAQLNHTAASMARLAAGKSGPFQRICRGLLEESAPGTLAGWRILFGRRRRRRRPEAGQDDWRTILGLVEPEERDELRQLLVLSRQHKELLESLITQQYYRNWLDVWLWVHLPLSVALLVLVTAHALVALYYRGV